MHPTGSRPSATTLDSQSGLLSADAQRRIASKRACQAARSSSGSVLTTLEQA